MDIHGYLHSHPHASADLVKALLRAESLEAPREAVKAFMQQKTNAQKRGIPFQFCFADWWEFWMQDNRWSRRGLTRGSLMMARFGDEGPYSKDNVYCATPTQNLADRMLKWKGKTPRRNVPHRRIKRPLKPVETPNGVFMSTVLAAKHFGITVDCACRRAKKESKGWRYVQSPSAPPQPEERDDVPTG